MRVLLLGATGFIGSAVAARLGADGHELVGVARRPDAAARRVPAARWRFVDLRDMNRPQDWLPHLAGIDAVVNAAGVLQDSLRDSTEKVHRDAPCALWQACAEAGVRRIVQISAIGVERGGATLFSRSKRDGDAALEATGLNWTILRPSVVVGPAAYGGSALLRALACLPFVPRIAEAKPLDVVQLDDLTETVARLLRPEAPARVALDLAGPERLSFEEVVAHYRRWFGWTPARAVRLPGVLLAPFWKAGDLVAWLGWRPPLRSTSRRELARGATGDNRDWIRLTGIRPRSLAESLAARPAAAQDRWFARLYLLKPLAIGLTAGFWLLTGIVALTAGREQAAAMMSGTAAAGFAEAGVVAGALADLAIGALILFRRTARLGLILAFSLSLLYLAAGSLLQPALWSDPLGPLLKILPILALNLLCLAILDER